MWKQSFGIAPLAPATTGTKGRMGLRPYWWGLHCTLHTYRTQGRASLDCSNQRWQKPSLKSHPNSVMLPLGKSPASNNKNIRSMVTSWKEHQLLWKVQSMTSKRSGFNCAWLLQVYEWQHNNERIEATVCKWWHTLYEIIAYFVQDYTRPLFPVTPVPPAGLRMRLP